MKTYKVTFTPSGPYFFGNEKTFKYPGQSVGGQYGDLYYIRGEAIPSQTAILGALRYLALPEHLKTFRGAKTREAAEIIGPESFDIDSPAAQEFGAIRSVSPLFITDGENDYIPTPFDHIPVGADGKKNGFYTPFSAYQPVTTVDGERLFTTDYDPKVGVAESWTSVKTGEITDGLFGSEVRVGIDTGRRADAFFKKEYKTLRKGCSFAVYAALEEMLYRPDTAGAETVLLGQGGVPFAVRFTEEENTLDGEIGTLLEKAHALSGLALAYCESDYLTDGTVPSGAFSVVLTKDYRSFRTVEGGRIEKGGELHKLIRAGSVFLFGKDDTVLPDARTEKQKNAFRIGMNHVHYIGGSHE